MGKRIVEVLRSGTLFLKTDNCKFIRYFDFNNSILRNVPYTSKNGFFSPCNPVSLPDLIMHTILKYQNIPINSFKRFNDLICHVYMRL